MTKYNWQEIEHTLATDVMGWEVDTKSNGHYLYQIGQYEYEVSYKWTPSEDLNQARMIGEQMTHYKLGFYANAAIECEAYKCIIHQDERARQASYKDPAKAICLAVLKAIDEDLSQYRESDSEETSDE